MIKNNNITAHCHFDRSDAEHRGAEKSIGKQIPRLVPARRDSLGMTRSRLKGLTLPEMTVVISIAALMVALTIPAANMLLNSFESESGAKSMINAALSSARSIAVKEQRYAGIRFQKRYDPANPDPLIASQYMIFIINETDRNLSGNITDGFRAVDGIQPIKLPDSIGIMDLLIRTNWTYPSVDGIGSQLINGNQWINSFAEVNDASAFSIIFSPSGKLVFQAVRVRNRNGRTTDTSQDEIFNTDNNVNAGIAMFLQDDYANIGYGSEMSRNGFVIYDTKKFNQAYNNGNAYTGYLQWLKPIYINPYTGTTVSEK